MPDLKKGDRLQFHMQKSPQYRTIHCDGAHGGVTSRAYIAFTLFSERNTIPRVTSREVVEVGPDNEIKLSPENVEDSLGGMMRQLEATVYMDINTAREFYIWFGKKLAQLEELGGLDESQRLGPTKLKGNADE